MNGSPFDVLVQIDRGRQQGLEDEPRLHLLLGSTDDKRTQVLWKRQQADSATCASLEIFCRSWQGHQGELLANPRAPDIRVCKAAAGLAYRAEWVTSAKFHIYDIQTALQGAFVVLGCLRTAGKAAHYVPYDQLKSRAAILIQLQRQAVVVALANMVCNCALDLGLRRAAAS